MGSDDHHEKTVAGAADRFILIDIEPSPTYKDPTLNPRLQLQKVLSRKGSQRLADAKVLEVDNSSDRGGVEVLGNSRFATEIVSAAADEGDVRWRRVGRQASTGLDPRRVLFFFATMSSMGTLILLYCTLSIRRKNRDDNW